MSGPTTVLIGADPISILLAAAAIRAAEAIAAGYAEAAHLNAEHQANRDAINEQQRSAIRQGQQAFAQEVVDAENRFEQLIFAAERLGIAEQVRATRPVRPEATDPLTLAAYVRGLQALADELEAHLLTESARRMDKFGEAPVGMEIPAEFIAPKTQQAATLLAQPAAQPISRRLLARIAHLGAVPEHIESIARELDGTQPGERADLLLLELGARIHAHIEALQKRMVREATATVVEQTLKDLGYQVEEIGSTLFVEGGVVHFRRQGWTLTVRRRLSLLERPIGTASKIGRTWYGYSAYRPENIEKVLTIFRVFYNYCLIGKDKKTPAMRLGLSRAPIDPQEIIYFV